MKIDVFCHVMPEKYKEARLKELPQNDVERESIESLRAVWDMDYRFKMMDKFDDLMQVITINLPFVDTFGDRETVLKWARLANDGMAELVMKYPDRFAAAVACLPLSNIDDALKEADRCVTELKFRGVQIGTAVNGKFLDDPELLPLYEKMSSYNLPIFIHPEGSDQYAEYRISRVFGWPYKTTVAMSRLVFGKVLERYPNLKFITHHCGGLVPFLSGRIRTLYDGNEMLRGATFKDGLTRPLLDYFRMFYFDTAICGNAPALMCGYAFCGSDHMLFGTDSPHDNQHGLRSARETIEAIEQMEIPDTDKEKIFSENARRILRLPV